MSKRTLLAALVAVGFLMAADVVEWASLMDIFHDYASPTVIQYQTKLPADELPAWTICEGEWNRAMAVVYGRSIALLVLGAVLARGLLRRERPREAVTR